jgi:hypothetical protein
MSIVGEQSLLDKNRLKGARSVGFEKSNDTIPRTEFSLSNIVEELRPELESSSIHQKVAEELSKPKEEIFTDILSIGKLLLQKAVQMEQNASQVQLAANKIHSRMVNAIDVASYFSLPRRIARDGTGKSTNGTPDIVPPDEQDPRTTGGDQDTDRQCDECTR